MRPKLGKGLILLGIVLIVASLSLTAWNIVTDRRAGQESEEVRDALRAEIGERKDAIVRDEESETDWSEEIVYPDYVLNPDMPMPVKSKNGYDYIALLEIPSLKLALPVMDDWSLSKLATAPCRYAGSVYSHDIVICAHNFESHFGRIYTLTPGDEVIVTDMDGNVFRYEVLEQETLGKTADEQMRSGKWDLTLFTCTVGGASRVTVRCALKHDESLTAAKQEVKA